MHVILDNKSNRSLARSDFFDMLRIKSSPAPYTQRTCTGLLEMAGRNADGFCAEAVSGGVSIHLPPLIECNEISDN